LPKMKVKQFKYREIIFPTDEIYVIIYGDVEVRRHEAASRLSSIVGKYQEGHVIGVDELDKGQSSHLESWNICLCEVETIQMKKSDFLDLWHLQELDTKVIQYNLIKVMPLFKNISEQSLKMLAFELVTVRSY